ncbi:MAG: glycosyltransferase family 4 protein [Kineosporiaceae bacterium]
MHIGLIAPPWIPVPPPGYGGTEVVVDNLARGLVALGHDVRLFTVGESTCPVTRLYYYATAVEPMHETALEVTHLVAAYEELGDVDVIHDHTLAGPLLASIHPRDAALVVTHHGLFDEDMRRVFAVSAREAAVVAISRAQARSARGVPVAAVIHHGIDTAEYSLGAGDGNYLLFLGRMSPDKGADRALRVAHRAGRRMVLVTKMRTRAERDYFRDEVRPLLAPDDELLVEPDLTARLDLLRHAEALLNPITWPEPFGLVMAEALGCGTPVLAFPYGAAPEIVEHGATGFLCSDEDDMLDRLGQVDDLDRGACRASAERRFSLPRMAADHERLYRKLLAARAAGTTGGGVTELARTRATPVWARRDRLGAGRRASGGPTAPFTPPAPGDGRVQGA